MRQLLVVLLSLAAGVNAATVKEAARVQPTPEQVAWQKMEIVAFVHFGINTFTDREWGDGTEDPKLFNPTAFDADQWVRACKAAGIKGLVLTVKHHDGFCLWPSAFTEHSVKNSPWRGGRGDVVREVAEACRRGGIRFGIYLSPWDRHEPAYGTPRYNDHYQQQLRELLTGYGDFFQLWLDGAKGKNAKNMEYDWAGIYSLARELQPHMLVKGGGDRTSKKVFADGRVRGPDVRWVGNERGVGRETEWSVFPVHGPVLATNNLVYDLGSREKLRGAERLIWWPAEVDVSIRPGWFYHASQDDKVKTLDYLLDIYYKSVGRNALLLLNLPPDRRGLIHENDVARLREFRRALDETFARNFTAGRPARATEVRGNVISRVLVDPAHGPDRLVDGDRTTYWSPAGEVTSASVEIDLGSPATFNVALLQEYIEQGQRVEEFTIDAWIGAGWSEIFRGTTIGYKRLPRFDDVTTSRVRLTILGARAAPMISELGLYHASPEHRGLDRLEFKNRKE